MMKMMIINRRKKKKVRMSKYLKKNMSLVTKRRKNYFNRGKLKNRNKRNLFRTKLLIFIVWVALLVWKSFPKHILSGSP